MAAALRIRMGVAIAGALVAANAAARMRAASSGFDGRNVVLTGGSRGLGIVLARILLERGANVTIAGRSSASLAAAAAKLGGADAPLSTFVCDVRDRIACERLIAHATEHFGPIDLLINNAGVIEVGPLEDQALDDFREAMETHFWGPLHTMLAVLPAMRARRSGHIVNVASIGGIFAVPHLAPYSASKFAQIGLTQAIAAEAGRDGVRVTSVIPGLMRTGSTDHAIFKGRHRAEYAWFTLSDANPLLSVSVEGAARRILAGIAAGETCVQIGWTVPIARAMNALSPRATTQLLTLAVRLLPRPGGIKGARKDGAHSHSAVTENPLTLPDRRGRPKDERDALICGNRGHLPTYPVTPTLIARNRSAIVRMTSMAK